MNTHTDKTTETKSNAVAPGMAVQQTAEHEGTLQLEDNRPETIAQRKIQDAANNSPQVTQLKAMQAIANSSTQAYQLKCVQAMADNSTGNKIQHTGINEIQTASHELKPVQRVVGAAAFTRLDHSVVAAPVASYARLKRDADDVVCVARRNAGAAGGFEVATSAAPTVWVAVTAVQLRDNYTWTDERIDYHVSAAFEADKSKRQKTKKMGADAVASTTTGADAAALTVSEFAGDDLAMVHHTTGGGSAAHLTVENAHISALHHIMDNRTISGFNKGGRDKPAHEAFMKGYESTATDNLNFFAASPAQATLELSLANYLRVISHAMDQIAHVPPAYGVEVVRSANTMAAAKGMDPAALFLPSGKGMERQLFKAAMNMHKMGLIAVPAAITTAFTGYAQSNPTLTNPDTAAVVAEGAEGWSALQTRLVDAHLAALITYLKTL